MDHREFDIDEENGSPYEAEPVIDFTEDPIEVADASETNDSASDIYSDDPEHRIDNAELDNALDEFVDVVNGRDLEGLLDLLAADVRADFLGEGSRDGVVDGFNDLFLRNPTLLVTRADLGDEPLAAVWAFDVEADRFDPIGYMTLEMGEEESGMIQRIDYVDELGDTEDLVVESPDRSELPEWDEWSEVDED